jgi:hypothetical protein
MLVANLLQSMLPVGCILNNFSGKFRAKPPPRMVFSSIPAVLEETGSSDVADSFFMTAESRTADGPDWANAPRQVPIPRNHAGYL